MRIGSLFSGIGGLELGLERAGLGHTVWQVEINPYCRQVLAKHWPNVERHEDVRAFRPGERVDLVCGGFPCQPWSVAGKRRGHDDERHLWPEFARVIDEAQPTWVVGENVPGLRARGLRGVLADLAARGFDVEWTDIRASDVGAPHRRERIFIVASHPERLGVRLEPGWLSGALRTSAALASEHGDGGGPLADANGKGLEVGQLESARAERAPAERGRLQGFSWPAEPDVGRVAHGVSRRVDRLAALGNAVVPQVAEVIGRAIQAVMP
jgi:DNA (cytosine-5)-methyltransferase 1